jgi:hypothetical protein
LLTGYNPTKKITLCGIGILPVADRIETHQKKITLCGTGILPVADRIETHQKKIHCFWNRHLGC